MSRPPTYARKVDSSHRAIVRVLEAAGCSVVAIQSPRPGLPDLIVGVAGRTHLVECKPPSTRKDGAQSPQSSLRATQASFAARWRGSPVHVLRTPAEAVELVNLLRLTADTLRQAAEAKARENARGSEIAAEPRNVP